MERTYIVTPTVTGGPEKNFKAEKKKIRCSNYTKKDYLKI
jgi:hypothetical protein